MAKYIDRLRKCTCIADLVSEFELKVTAKEFGYIVYYLNDDLKYEEFDIPKKNGSLRKIHSPKPALKYIQKEFSSIIFNCINEIRLDNVNYLACNHAFERDKSIVSNADLHKNKKFILNIDIKDFFSSIHYGRVKGFFIHDENFRLNKNIAQIIARLATYHKRLPQGSPLSPIIATLIGNIMDTRFLKLAKKYRFTYSRYADDITLSSNQVFDENIVYWNEDSKKWIAGRAVIDILTNSGFEINLEKTRVSYSNNRQVVTGIVVNKQRNVALEYRRTNRAMVYSLLSTGSFNIDNENIGNIEQLIGRLNHAIYVKFYNPKFPLRLNLSDRIESKIKKKEELIKAINSKWRKNTDYDISSDHQMRLLRSVLYFKYIVSIGESTIFSEGYTDPIYFHCAKENLKINSDLKFQRINYSTKKIGIYSGASSINGFIEVIANKPGDFICYSQIKIKAKHPAIFILDYDNGLDDCGFILSKLKNNEQYAYIKDNIYVLLLKPKGEGNKPYKKIENMVCIENLISFNGNKIESVKEKKEYVNFNGKELKKGTFANYVKEHASDFDYRGFNEIFEKIKEIEKDYATRMMTNP